MQGAQKKERGAVALKKGLDRLVTDLNNPELKVPVRALFQSEPCPTSTRPSPLTVTPPSPPLQHGEDEAAQAILNEEMKGSEDAATDELSAQLNILNKQEEAIQRGLARAEGAAEPAEGGADRRPDRKSNV